MIVKNFTVQLKEAYVYIHRRLSDGTVFYIGKGRKCRWANAIGRSDHWKHIANKHGVICDVVGNNLTDSEAILLESYLISFHGRITDGGYLVNITSGGEGMAGYRHSTESRLKISRGNLGKRVNLEGRANISRGALNRERTSLELEQLAQARSILSRPVVCIESGVVYSSAKDAARAINGDHSCIIKVCLGKRKSHMRLTWKYAI